MILGVNGIRLMGQRSGVGRAVEAILATLADVDQPFDDVRVYTPAPLSDDVLLPGFATNVVLPSHLSPALWEQWTLPRAHGTRHVLLCPSYVLPLAARCPTLLIHHGSYEGYPAAFSWWSRNKARGIYTVSAWRATAVSTVSQSSKRDMVRFYRLPPDRIHVIPEGVDTGTFRPIDDPAVLSRWRVGVFGIDVPFVVYVGKPTERRNITTLLTAFSVLKREARIEHKLLIAGADLPGNSPVRELIDDLRIGDDVVVKGYVGHDEMPLVYNAADALLYPSAYEGFGMPVVEAMACGTPVVALDNTALPEIAGGVALLLPDAQVPTLIEGIRTLIDDATLRARMSVEGPPRAAQFDWRVVTQQYADLLRSIARP